MRIKIGYDISYHHFQTTPVILMTEVHQPRVADLERLDIPQSKPVVPIEPPLGEDVNWLPDCSGIGGRGGDNGEA